MRACKRTWLLPSLSLALVIVVTTLASAPSARAAEAPALSVQGNQLVAGGQPVSLHGINRGAYTECDYTIDDNGSADSDADGPVDQASVSAITAWGVNVVRLPISESCWLGLAAQPSDGDTEAAYRSQVESYVNLLGANGLYVIVDLQSTAPPGDESGSIDTFPDEAESPAFWTSVTAAFGSDQFVMFDLINEVAASQYNTSYTEDQRWACWLNGCSGVPSLAYPGTSYTSAGIQQLIDTVRATDTTTPLIIGSPDYNFDKTEFSSHVPQDPSNTADPQLIYDDHLYDFSEFGVDSTDDADPTSEASAVSQADAYISGTLVPIAQTYPVMIGELGQQDCDDTTTGTAPFDSGVLSDLSAVAASDSLNLSVLGWTWDANSDNGNPLGTGWGCPTDDYGDGGPLLIRDFNGTPTVSGAAFRTWFLAHETTTTSGGTSTATTGTQTTPTTPTTTPTTTAQAAPTTTGTQTQPATTATVSAAAVTKKVERPSALSVSGGAAKITLKLTCAKAATSCESFTFTGTVGKRTVVSGRGSVKPGRPLTRAVKLNATGIKLLKHGRLKVKLVIRSHGRTLKTKTVTVTKAQIKTDSKP